MWHPPKWPQCRSVETLRPRRAQPNDKQWNTTTPIPPPGVARNRFFMGGIRQFRSSRASRRRRPQRMNVYSKGARTLRQSKYFCVLRTPTIELILVSNELQMHLEHHELSVGRCQHVRRQLNQQPPVGTIELTVPLKAPGGSGPASNLTGPLTVFSAQGKGAEVLRASSAQSKLRPARGRVTWPAGIFTPPRMIFPGSSTSVTGSRIRCSPSGNLWASGDVAGCPRVP